MAMTGRETELPILFQREHGAKFVFTDYPRYLMSRLRSQGAPRGERGLNPVLPLDFFDAVGLRRVWTPTS